MSKRNMVCRIACLATLVLAGGAQGAWVVNEVPMLPGWNGGAELRGINDSGVACGYGNYVVNGTSTGIRFDGTTVTELPHLEPADPITLCIGINSRGVVCGYSRNAEADSQAVYWVGTTLYTIPYPPDADVHADFRAYGLNDAGVIVGCAWTPTAERIAWYYKDGSTYSLDATIRAAGLFGTQEATAVNNADVVCGTARDALNKDNVWTYNITTGVLTILGRIGTESCSATAINLSGHTIGRAKQNVSDMFHAVTYDGAWHVVDPNVNVVQWGLSINDPGRMVGQTGTGTSRWSWYSDGAGAGSIKAVTLPGWSQLNIQALNNDDQMVAYGVTPTSGAYTRGCIISPPPGDANHDGKVAFADVPPLALCLSGPAGGPVPPPSSACLKAFDFAPADADVDLADVATFQLVFEGS